MIKNILKKTQVLFFVVMSSLYFSDIALSFGKLKKDKKPTDGKTAEEVKKLAIDFVRLVFDSKSEVVKTDFELTLKVSYDNYATINTFLVPAAAAKPAATQETQSYILDYYKVFNAEPVTESPKAATTDTTKVEAEVTGTVKAGATVSTTGGAAAGTQVKPEDALAQLLEGIWDETVDVGKDSFGAKIKEWLGQKDYTTGLAKLAVDAAKATDEAKKKAAVQTILGKIEISFATEWKADTLFEMTFKVNLGTSAMPTTLDEIYKKTAANFLTITTPDLEFINLVDLQRMGYHLVKFTFGEEALALMADIGKNSAELIKLIIDDATKSNGVLATLITTAGTVGEEAKGKFTIAKVDADGATKNGLYATHFGAENLQLQYAPDDKAYPTALTAAPYLEWTMGADHYVVFERAVDAAVKTFALNFDKMLETPVNPSKDFKHIKYDRFVGGLVLGSNGVYGCPNTKKAFYANDTIVATSFGLAIKDFSQPTEEDLKAIEFPPAMEDADLPICFRGDRTDTVSPAQMKASAYSLVGLNFAVFQEEPSLDLDNKTSTMIVFKRFFQFAQAINKMTKDATTQVGEAYKDHAMFKFIKALTKDVQTTIKDGGQEYNLLEMIERVKGFFAISPISTVPVDNANIDNMFGANGSDGTKGFWWQMSENDPANQFTIMINGTAGDNPGVLIGNTNMNTKFPAGSILVDFVGAKKTTNIIFYKRHYSY